MRWLLPFTILSVCALSQSPPPAADQGLESPDAARQIVTKVLQEDDQLREILKLINPQEWYEKKGAPAVYTIQVQSANAEAADLDRAAHAYLSNPENLPSALDLYFRMEGLESRARSIQEGARQYADPAAAQRLGEFAAKNFDARQRFRDYIAELTVNLNNNFKIADEEAQRCRAQASSAPPCPTTGKRKRG